VVRRERFSAQLEDLMNRYMRQQLTSAQLIVELVELAKEVSADARRGQQFDPPLNHAELAFYDAIAQNGAATELMGVDTLAEIARELVRSIQSSITVDWFSASRYARSCAATSAGCWPATTTRRTTNAPPSTWFSGRWKPSPTSGRQQAADPPGDTTCVRPLRSRASGHASRA
jgi:hypothetical protein